MEIPTAQARKISGACRGEFIRLYASVDPFSEIT